MNSSLLRTLSRTLLWAKSKALKFENISINHAFKGFAKIVFILCRLPP